MRSPLALLALLSACGSPAAPPGRPSSAVDAGVLADARPTAAAPVKRTPAEIAARSTPAIVTIHTDHSLGTGFVVDRDGLIATNVHVIAGGNPLTVVFADKRQFPVIEVTSHDSQLDLAVVRIAAADLPALSLGDSDRVHPGDPIVAIGHPLGLEDTVSNGLISAVRKLETVTVLQISAPIAPGSSGGPIFNENGEVVGVSTAVLVGGQNLNFGLPSNYVRALLASPRPMSMADFAAETTTTTAAAGSGPAIVRKVPLVSTSALDGCSAANLDLVMRTVAEAIDVGAPLYNSGNHAGCYHIYEGAALDLGRKLPASCRGASAVLEAGRKRAAGLPTPTEQAWAMRDAFDGVSRAILQKRGRGKAAR